MLEKSTGPIHVLDCGTQCCGWPRSTKTHSGHVCIADAAIRPRAKPRMRGCTSHTCASWGHRPTCPTLSAFSAPPSADLPRDSGLDSLEPSQPVGLAVPCSPPHPATTLSILASSKRSPLRPERPQRPQRPTTSSAERSCRPSHPQTANPTQPSCRIGNSRGTCRPSSRHGYASSSSLGVRAHGAITQTARDTAAEGRDEIRQGDSNARAVQRQASPSRSPKGHKAGQ